MSRKQPPNYDNRKPPPPSSTYGSEREEMMNRSHRQASGGLITPNEALLHHSQMIQQQQQRTPPITTRAIRGIDDDDVSSAQPPSRPSLTAAQHHQAYGATANNHNSRNNRGGGRNSDSHQTNQMGENQGGEAAYQPPWSNSNESQEKNNRRRYGSNGLVSVESNVQNEENETRHHKEQGNHPKRNRRHRDHGRRKHPEETRPSPPQKRDGGPPPEEDRPFPRKSSFAPRMLKQPINDNSYHVLTSDSLGPLPTSPTNQSHYYNSYAPPIHHNPNQRTNDTYAVDAMLYETASVVMGGPDYVEDYVSFAGNGDGHGASATNKLPTSVAAADMAAANIPEQYNRRVRGSENTTATTRGRRSYLSRRSGPSVPGYNVPSRRDHSGGGHRPTSTAPTAAAGGDGDNGIVSAQQQQPSDIYHEEFFDEFDFALFELSELCATSGRLELNGNHTEEDYIEHDLSWNRVREWLQNHSPEHLFPYLQARDEYGKTALHFAAQNQPPMDIMEYLMHAILNSGHPQLLEAQDAFLWTPLHYACAFAAPIAVLQSLAEYRDSAKLLTTNKGLTPLHLALIGPIRDAPDIIAILASNGATKIADQQGLLPIHYACAFGASEESLRVLIDIYPEALVTKDNFGRNPLHFALANTKTNPKAAPITVRLLLTLRPSLVNPSQDDDGPNPFLFLLEYATQINSSNPDEALKNSIQKCLNLLLAANPNPTPTVFTALRSLPYWLFPTAILSQTVQDLLNDKIKGRFPTIILMLDFYLQIVVLIFYHLCVDKALYDRNDLSETEPDLTSTEKQKLLREDIDGRFTAPLFVGGTYFLLREFIQVFSLIYLKSFRTLLRVWILHMSDWLDLSYIGVVYIWAIVILCGKMPDTEEFATWSAVSASILWGKLFIYLRSASFDFSIFVSGVFYVGGRLFPYIIVLTSFFIGFSQIFHTIFFMTADYGCIDDNGDEIDNDLTINELQCENYGEKRPFCDRWDSFLRVYTMFLGEVDDDDFKSKTVAIVFFGFFMFLMVILLANVLIAIVTDSYKVIQDREATLVFYTNRLYFLAETDAIGNVPCFNFFQSQGRDLDYKCRQAWQTLLYSFELGPHENIGSAQFWKFRFVPIAAACFIIPFWFLLGLVTCGAIWPPQLREWFFANNTHRQRGTIAQMAEEEQTLRRQEESLVEVQVIKTRDEFYQSLAENRQQLSQIKAAIAERKQEIRKEMKRIKIIMGNLLEQAEQSDDDDDDYYDD